MQITVTETAVKQLLDSGLDQDNFLRLGVQPGGCAGMSYAAFIDDAVTGSDQVIFEQSPLRIVADSEFLDLLDGLNIDFSDDLVRPGFILKNPKVKQSCGCGSSFKTEGAGCGSGGCGS